MPLKLFELDNPYFVGMTACGVVQADEEPAKELFARHRGREMRAEAGFVNSQMILCTVWGKKANSLHIDFVKSQAYKTVRPEAELATLEEIQHDLDGVIGQRIAGTFFGRYAVPLEKMPDKGIIVTLSFEMRSGKMSMSTTGAELAITGAPVDTLSWRFNKNRKKVTVDLTGKMDQLINEHYLIELKAALERSFTVLVMQDSSDGNLP